MNVKKLIASLVERHNEQEGFILPVLLITGLMIVLMIMAVSGQTVTNRQTAQHANYAVEAQLAADAGLDNAMNKMNTVSNWAGTSGDCPSGECVLLSDATGKIKTTYSVSVTAGADNLHKLLSVTAKTYSPTTAITPKLTRKYVMDIEAVTSGTGSTSVSSGVGGLILQNNAKISGGDVVVNGTITMSQNSQIGLSTNAVNVRVADQKCPIPANSTYPQVCPGGSPEPISMINNAKIYADVIATNQTTGTNMFNDGLQAGQSFAPVSLPTFDRTGFKNTVNASGQNMTGVQASNCVSKQITWPANLKITGNVTITNGCTVKLNGNVWISGTLTVTNNSFIAIQDSAGTTVPDVVVDGYANGNGVLLTNNSKITPNASGTGLEFLTFYSTAPCSPDCTTLTGPDLYNSQSIQTINLTNNVAAPRTILYAYWSKATIANNGQLGAVAAQTVSLTNNAVITFTASVPGSNNLVTTWTKRGYMRVYN